MIPSGSARRRGHARAGLRRSFMPVFPGWRPFFLVFAVFCLSSACVPQAQVTQPDREPFAALADRLRREAVSYENSGELRQALLHWWILQSLRPADGEIPARVDRLRQETGAKAAEHFQQGVAFYRQGLSADARREFLTALTYEQDHAETLDYLRNRLHEQVFTTYQVQQGDTFREVARRVYHDPDKEFLVAAFNGGGGSGEPAAGTELKLVVLDQRIMAGGDSADAIAPQAEVKVLAPRAQKRKVVADGYGYGGADSASKPQRMGGNAEQNAEKYRQAKELLGLKDPAKALRILRTIEPAYRDVEKIIAATEASIQQEADARYRRGVSSYLAGDLDQAIKEWEEVLRLRPDDLRAKKDLLNARRQKEKARKFR